MDASILIPMKDTETGDTPRWAGKHALTRGFPNGEPILLWRDNPDE